MLRLQWETTTIKFHLHLIHGLWTVDHGHRTLKALAANLHHPSKVAQGSASAPPSPSVSAPASGAGAAAVAASAAGGGPRLCVHGQVGVVGWYARCSQPCPRQGPTCCSVPNATRMASTDNLLLAGSAGPRECHGRQWLEPRKH